jgi:DNA modification methylase
MSLLLQGDALDHLAILAEKNVQVHMVATSPPYFRQRDYDVPDSRWPEVIYAPMFDLPPIAIEPWTGQLGREDNPFAFIGHCVHVCRLVARVLRSDGTLWLNMGDKYVGDGGKAGRDLKNKNRSREDDALPPGFGVPGEKNLLGVPWRLALALQADGWTWRNEIIWEKPNASPHPVRDRLTVSHEPILLFSRSRDYYWDHEPIRTPLAESTKSRELYPRAFQRRENQSGHSENPGTPRVTGEQCSVRHDHESPSSPAGAQRRTVWRYPTRHALEGHYAVWPHDLVAPMILAATSGYGCCKGCGAPYARIVEAEPPPEDIQPRSRKKVPGQPDKADLGRNNRLLCAWRETHPPRTVGWRKSCSCETQEIVRPVVLDPFGGEMSTGEEACRLGRDFVGIDADPKNIRVGRKRLKPLENLPLLDLPVLVATTDDLRPPVEPAAPQGARDQKSFLDASGHEEVPHAQNQAH